MAQVRKNPLPAGRYWIFIQAASQDIWDLWAKKNSDVLTIEVNNPIADPNLSQPDISVPGMPGVEVPGKPNERFYIFALKEPAIWPRGVGFPNVATPDVTMQRQVQTRPPIPTAVDVVKDIAQTAAEAALEMRNRLIMVGALYLAWQWEQRNKGR
jgi:hypothetical protein